MEFELNRDIEAAANDVRDRVARAVRQLPDEVEPPVICPPAGMFVKSRGRNALPVNCAWAGGPRRIRSWTPRFRLRSF